MLNGVDKGEAPASGRVGPAGELPGPLNFLNAPAEIVLALGVTGSTGLRGGEFAEPGMIDAVPPLPVLDIAVGSAAKGG